MDLDNESLSASARASALYNEDLAPVPPARRTWTRWNFAALWVGMAVCVPTYMLAGGLIQAGMNWWQALTVIALGNVIVLVPMVLNGIPGARHGIPFPVLIRSSFGWRGAVWAGLLRALVACGWFGIQCWIGGSAIYQLLLIPWPGLTASPVLGEWLGLNVPEVLCFAAFWLLNVAIVFRGIESIKVLENWAAPFLLVMGLVLLGWAVNAAGSFAAIFAASESMRGDASGTFAALFWPSLTAMVGFWATLSLNIPDFTRYAENQRAHIEGQIIGLPATMLLFSFIGIVVTSATLIVFDEAIWNPVDLLGRFHSPIVIGVSLVALTLATLSTNLAANVVAAANDIANIAPRRLSFRHGGVITGVVGVLMCPWKLVADPQGYIFLWLVAYSALLGAIAGVMLWDYFVVRRGSLEVNDLFDDGPAARLPRWNRPAWIAVGVALLPVLPGFGIHVGLLDDAEVGAIWSRLYDYAWFLTLFLSAGVYAALKRGTRTGESVQAA